LSEKPEKISDPAAVRADALVFFGATGDLAHKKIFPALQALAERGHLDMPVIGVAKAGWTLEQLKARARDSVERYGGPDAAAFERLSRLLRYIDGDYADASTFERLRRELGPAQHPIHSPARRLRLRSRRARRHRKTFRARPRDGEGAQ
jgi:glucose-6-phosphate 1-dehydrogenase